MTAILKVDTIQDTAGNNIINESSNTITIGASGDTISIPSGATITNSGTANNFGGGKIGQVLQAVKTDTFSTTSTSFTDVTGVTQAITPAATSSKILVNITIHGVNTAGDSGKSGDTGLPNLSKYTDPFPPGNFVIPGIANDPP